MAELVAGVSWLAVGLSTIICFMLGALWYSPVLFGTRWAEGVNIEIGPGAKQPVGALVTQFLGTLLLAWIVALAYTNGSVSSIVLIVAAFALLLVAANLFAEHSLYAALAESGFIAVMAVIMLVCNLFL